MTANSVQFDLRRGRTESANAQTIIIIININIKKTNIRKEGITHLAFSLAHHVATKATAIEKLQRMIFIGFPRIKLYFAKYEHK